METIKRLNTDPLKHNDIAFEYYRQYFNFQYCHNCEYRNIPIPERISIFIDGISQTDGIRFPWHEYAVGFIEQYKKGMPLPYIDDIEAKRWNILQGIAVPEIDTVSFDKEKAFDYGQSVALSFLAWEIVIRDLPTYEYLFVKSSGNSFADFLLHEKAKELSQYLTPLIQNAKGTEIGIYFLALREMQLINFADRYRQRVYDSLGLERTQYIGANTAISGHPNKCNRSSEILTYTNQIKKFLDSLA